MLFSTNHSAFCTNLNLQSRREKVEPIPFKAPEVNPVTKFSQSMNFVEGKAGIELSGKLTL